MKAILVRAQIPVGIILTLLSLCGQATVFMRAELGNLE
jgi:hypothetical protein